MKITEGQLKQLVGESLKSVLKERYYMDGSDGKYEYLGTGSDASADRIEQIKDKKLVPVGEPDGKYGAVDYEDPSFVRRSGKGNLPDSAEERMFKEYQHGFSFGPANNNFDANELYEGIDEEWKNKGRFIFQQITKRLSLSIYNFIREMEESYKPYTKDDIRKYMAPGFAVLQRKHPTLQPKVLDNCIDYIINKERKKLYCFKENSSPVNEAKKPARLKESELRNLIRESVVRVLNESWIDNRDAGSPFDGRYQYQGVGSEASEERMKKIRDKNSSSRLDDKYNDHGKEGTSPFGKKRKEFGDLESTVNLKGAKNDLKGTQNKSDGLTYQIYDAIRDFAGGRMTPEDFVLDMKYSLKTPEQAAAFIKFLHLNGFKTEKI